MDTNYNNDIHNSSYIKIYAKPYNEQEEIKRNLTLNWEIIEFKGKYLDI